MTRPYSEDLRRRAVVLVKDGRSCRAVARLLGLGEASVIRWVRRERRTGSAAAKPTDSRRRFVLLGERHQIEAPGDGIQAALRDAKAIVELRVPFELARQAIDDVERGATDRTGRQ